MKTILVISFIARSPKIKPTYQARSWDFPNKKEAIKFAKTAYLSDYSVDKIWLASWNCSKKEFKHDLM